MRRMMLTAKIHRATVTGDSTESEGALSVDRDLLDAAGILPYEQVHVGNLSNGQRLVSYVLAAERGSRIVEVNGDAAHVIKTGDHLEIATYSPLSRKVARRHVPTVVIVDERNQPQGAVPPEEVPATPPLGPVPRRRGRKPVQVV